MQGMFNYGCMHFIQRLVDSWTETPADCHDKAWNGKDNFFNNSDMIRLIKEVKYT